MRCFQSKKQKVIATVSAVLLLFLILGTVCWTGTIERSAFNRSSAIDFDLGASFRADDARFDAYAEQDGDYFGLSIYQRQDGCARIKISKYPDELLGGPCITGIALLEGNTQQQIVGIYIGDRANVAHDRLGEHHFRVTHAGAGMIRAERGNIVILVSINEKNRVSEISAELISTNFFRLQYK